MRRSVESSGDALIGIPEKALRDAGVTRVARLDNESGGLPVCRDVVPDPRVIVWCTGFSPDYRWINLPVFGADGFPRHERGIVPDAPGLFFLGLRFQHRLNSSLIGGVGEDAAFIASMIARRSELRIAA